MLLSAVIPFFNERDNLAEVVERTRAAILASGCSGEILLVDNASNDGSEEVALSLVEDSDDVVLVRFTRNFGPSTEASIQAGLKYSTGDRAVIVYSDLQDPPEYIPEMMRILDSGAEVAYGNRKSRSGDGWLFILGSRIFYSLFGRLSESPTYGNVGDFMMISRRVIDTILSLPETGRFFRGLVPWLGFKAEKFDYHRDERKNGKSKTRLDHALNTAVTGFLSFSNLPLRVLLRFGVAIAVVSTFALVTQVFLWVVGSPVPGLTTIISLGFLNLGITTFSISLVGEYVGRTFIEVKQRPMYVVEAVHAKRNGPTGA